MLKWIFFDIGNVLFNDDQQAFFGYLSLFEALQETNPQQTFSELMSAREAEAKRGRQWIISHLAKSRLTTERYSAWSQYVSNELRNRYDEFHLLNPHAIEMLQGLRAQYRLGIIANQTTACRPSLERRGLMEYFDLVGISDELGCSKPDRQIFEWALKKAGCHPGESLMIGDRVDNDMLPASELGMQGLLVHWRSFEQKLWQPQDRLAREFLASCTNVPLFPHGLVDFDRYPYVNNLGEIPEKVAEIEQSA